MITKFLSRGFLAFSPSTFSPGAAPDPARACLDLLMGSRLFDPDMGDELRAYLHVVMSLEDETAAARLAAHGLRCVFKGRQGVLIANAGATLERVFEGSAFANMRWRYALLDLPGALPCAEPRRFGDQAHRATYVPLALALA
jgi:hypothetical protein